MNIRYQTSKIGHRTCDIENQALGIRRQNQILDIRHQSSGIGHWTWDIEHGTSDIGLKTSEIGHQTSDIQQSYKKSDKKSNKT